MQKDEYEAQLGDLEIRLERLRSLYEQYFLGIEKLEPGVARKDVDRRFWELRRIRMRNTALRFRFQTLIQRYNTLQQYWQRICRQIENGTYSRHVRKAARIASAPPPPVENDPSTEVRPVVGRGTDGAFDLGQMLAEDLAADAAVGDALEAAFAAVQGSTEPAKAAPAPRRPAPRREDPGADRFSRLHQELLRARKGLNQGEVSLESVADRLRNTEAQLRSKHPGKAVDFRVEVKDGKAVIKPYLR